MSIQESISKLQADVEALSAHDNSQLVADVASVKSQLSDVLQGLASLSSQDTQMRTDFSNLISGVQISLTSIKSVVDNISASVGTAPA